MKVILWESIPIEKRAGGVPQDGDCHATTKWGKHGLYGCCRNTPAHGELFCHAHGGRRIERPRCNHIRFKVGPLAWLCNRETEGGRGCRRHKKPTNREYKECLPAGEIGVNDKIFPVTYSTEATGITVETNPMQRG